MSSEYAISHYMQIKSYLLKLVSEKYPHEILPSEQALATMFEVSRGTAKQAITELVNEQVLYRKQGKGTFVSPKKIVRTFAKLPYITDDIKNMGYKYKIKIISLALVNPSEELNNLFKIAEPQQVVKMKRLIYIDEVPFSLMTIYLNPLIYPTLTFEDHPYNFRETLKRKYGVLPEKAHDTYSILSADAETAKILEIERNNAVWHSIRVSYTATAQVAEYIENYICAERFSLDINIGTDPHQFDPDNPSTLTYRPLSISKKEKEIKSK